MYDICKNKLGIKMPNYNNLNKVIAHVMASMTASIRFDGSLNVDLAEIKTNLVPYSRLNFLIPSFSPFTNKNK